MTAGTCGGCVWRRRGRCLPRDGARVTPHTPACEHLTPTLDCLACGACCREAYHTVEVSRRDPFRALHPDRVVQRDGRLHVPRTGRNWCVCLGDDYRCAVYADRPRTCRDFERGSANCLEARRRVGLS